MTEREGALRLALDAAGMRTWGWRRPSGEVEWDARMATLFGVGLDEFAGTVEAWTTLVHPDDRERMATTFEDAMESRTVFNVVHRVASTTAAVRWLESWGRVFVDDASGEITGARGVAV